MSSEKNKPCLLTHIGAPLLAYLISMIIKARLSLSAIRCLDWSYFRQIHIVWQKSEIFLSWGFPKQPTN